MRDFRLHELSTDTFESLVVYICRDALGIGTVGFSSGPDGGRDGRFEGTANEYPSASDRWAGKFIVQAKHTSNPVASCSDGDFETNATGVLAKEIPRVKALKDADDLDHYLLFTNRKLSGGTHARIHAKISTECGISNVGLEGLETISSRLEMAPAIVRACHLDMLGGPLRFHPEDLRDVIGAFHDQYVVDRIDSASESYQYVNIEEKNVINRLQGTFFAFIKERSEPYFTEIDRFLGSPINAGIREQYRDLADEFNNKIEIRRDQFGYYEEVFEHLYDAVLAQTPSLRQHRRLINTFLHYMYCSCDIGRKA